MESAEGAPSTPRKTTAVWNHFIQGTKRGHFYEAKCRYCDTIFTWGKAGEMEKHLRNKCPDCPDDVRDEFSRNINARAKPNTKRKERPSDADEQDEGAVTDDGEKETSVLPDTSKRNPIWSHYELGRKKGKCFEVTCRYCGTFYNWGKCGQMVNHIVKLCKDAPEEIKTQFVDYQYTPNASRKSQSVGELHLLSGADDGDDQSMTPDTVGDKSENPYEFEPAAEEAQPSGGTSLWQHFQKGGRNKKSYNASCKYCGKFFKQGRISDFRHHLARCETAPEDLRAQCALASPQEDRPGGSAARYVVSGSRKRRNYDEQAHGSKRMTRSATKAEAEAEDMDESGVALTSSQYEAINQALTKFMICCGLPLVTLEHPAFTQLLNLLNTSYNVPTVYGFGEIISEEIVRVSNRIKDELHSSGQITISIAAQHGKQDTVIVFSATGAHAETGERKSYFIKSAEAVPIQRAMLGSNSVEELGLEPRTSLMAYNLDEGLEQIAQELGDNKIVGVVCQEALSAAVTTEKISQKIIKVPCVLSVFLTLELLLQNEIAVQELILISEEITAVVTGGDSRSSERLYLTHGGISLGALQEALKNKEGVWPLTNINRANSWARVTEKLTDDMRIRRKVDSEDFWTELHFLGDLTRPLYDMWDSWKKQTLTMGDVYYYLLALGAKLSKGSALLGELTPHLATGFNKEFVKLDTALFRLVYILHPLYRGQGLHQPLSEKVLLQAGEISKQLGRTAEQTQAFFKQLKRYLASQAPFNAPFHCNDSPITFWEKLPATAGSELKLFAIRLLSIFPVSQLPLPFARTPISNLNHTMVETVGKLCGYYHANANEEFQFAASDSSDIPLLERLLSLDPYFHQDFLAPDASVAAAVELYKKAADEEDPSIVAVAGTINPNHTIFDVKPIYWAPTTAAQQVPPKPQEEVKRTEEYDVRELVLMELNEEQA